MSNKFLDWTVRLFYELKSKSARDFFMPRFTRAYLIRVGIVTACCLFIFGILLTPVWISGGSMEPTYRRIGFNFVNRLTYWRNKPQRGDIVAIYYEKKVMFLKRVVGLPGETVEFRGGRLFINGQELHEPYVKKSCDWELPPRKVQSGNFYMVGDNRSQPIARHQFGQVSARRIIGAPLW